MAEQIARAIRIDRAGALDGDVLGIKGLARSGFATGEELARVLAVAHHRAVGIHHGDAFHQHTAHATMDEDAGVDVLHEEAGLHVVRGVHVDGAFAGDAHVFDGVRLASMTDADAVGDGTIVGAEPGAAFVVPGLAAKADLHAMGERLPVARDRHALMRRLGKLAGGRRQLRGALRIVRAFKHAPGKGVRAAIAAFGVDPDGEDARLDEVKTSAHFQIVEFLARVLIGGDLGLGFELRRLVRELQRGPFAQLDVDRFVHVEDGPMLREAVLMHTGQKDQFVARSRAIHDRLGVVAGFDRMLRGMQQRGQNEEDEETHVWQGWVKVEPSAAPSARA